MSVSKVHHCISQEMVSQGIEEPPAAKCRCKKYIPLTAATLMVKNGEARWVVTKRTRGSIEERCRLCNGNLEVKKCAYCGDKRKVASTEVIEEYNDDIVLVSRSAVDPKEKKYRPALALKTPRVATIESKHILRAYVSDYARDVVSTAENLGPDAGFWDDEELDYDGHMVYNRERTSPKTAKAARDRIEEYGRLILEARMFVGKDRIPVIGVEPEDDQEKAQGRRFDYGRAI